MLWNRSSLSFDDLPNLQDMLRECDRDLLARVVFADHTLGGRSFAAYGQKRMRTFRKRLNKTLDELCELEVFEQAENDGHQVLLPQEAFALGCASGTLKREVRAALVSLDDARAVECARVALGQRAGTYRHARQAQKRARKRVRNACRSEVPLPREYRSVPWEEVLASRVWLGTALCRRERYMVLAEAVWEMTFYGFSQAEARASMARERAAGDVLCFGGAPSASSSRELDLGLVEPDHFEQGYARALSRRVAVLNHNALIDLYDLQLDVAVRCGLYDG